MRKHLGIAALLTATALLLLPQAGFAWGGRVGRGGYGYGGMYQGYYPNSYYPGGLASGSYYPNIAYSGSYITSGYYPGMYSSYWDYPSNYAVNGSAPYPVRSVSGRVGPGVSYMPPIYGSYPVARQAAYPPSSNEAVMDVHVPTPDARLWVDGERTTSTGLERRLASPPLTRGKNYHYTLKVSWMQDGRERTRTKDVDVRAGAHVNVDMAAPASRSAARPELTPPKPAEVEK